MAAPKITLTVGTANAHGFLCARLAATAPNSVIRNQLSFVVDVSNVGDVPVTLGELRVDFPGAPAIADHVLPMTFPTDTGPVDVVIPPDETVRWYNQAPGNLLLLGMPGEIRLAVTCPGYADPVTVTMPLVVHDGPDYRFPGKRADLDANEYWQGRSATHGAAGGGVQLFGYDLGAIGWNDGDGAWSRLHDGTNGSENEHYRIYGKPVYAMADGVVVSGRDDLPDNVPGQTAPAVVEGNHLYLAHGAEVMLYAHFQPGTVPDALLAPGTFVPRGTLLGVVGNSGNSTEPHLHLHAIEGTKPWEGPPRPIHFATFSAQATTNLGPAPDSTDWVKATGTALPPELSAVLPPRVFKKVPEFQPAVKVGKIDKILVAENSPGVDKGAPGWTRLPGGGRKPIGPR